MTARKKWLVAAIVLFAAAIVAVLVDAFALKTGVDLPTAEEVQSTVDRANAQPAGDGAATQLAANRHVASRESAGHARPPDGDFEVVVAWKETELGIPGVRVGLRALATPQLTEQSARRLHSRVRGSDCYVARARLWMFWAAVPNETDND